jgi:hypothetical protein
MNMKIKFSLMALILLMSGTIWAAPFLLDSMLTHEKFVMMSPHQQEQVVIKIMEFMVETEKKQNEALKKFGPKSKEYVHYRKILETLSHLFLAKAYAETKAQVTTRPQGNQKELPLTHFSNGYIQSFKRQVGDQCFYAGWPSRVNIQSDGRHLCLHPARLPPKRDGSPDDYTKYYHQATFCKEPTAAALSNGSAQISCNPAIFGFKKSTEISDSGNTGVKGTLFCVPAGLNISYDAAHACMQEALKDTMDGDTAQKRLETLRTNLASNPALANEVYKQVFQTCLCDSLPSKSKFDPTYVQKVRPHRTCFSLVQMMSTVACEGPTSPINGFDLQLFSRLKDMTSNSLGLATQFSGSQADQEKEIRAFTDKLNEFKSTQIHDFNVVCSHSKIQLACKTTCTIPGPSGVTLDAENPIAQSVNAPMSCDYEITKADGSALIPEVKGTESNVTASFEKAYGPDKVICEAKRPPQSGETESSELKAASSCTLALVGPKPAPEAEFKVRLTKNLAEDEVATPDVQWLPATQKTEEDGQIGIFATKEKMEISALFSVSKANKNFEIKCSLEVQPQSETTLKPTLALALDGGDEKNTKQKVMATTDAEIADGKWSLIWWKKANAAAPPRVSRVAGDSSAEESIEKTPVALANPEDIKPEPTGFQKDHKDKKDIEVAKEVAVYQMCAKLLKGSEVVKASPECIDIPALKAEVRPPVPTPNGGGMRPPQGGPPMGGGRMGFGTRAGGI